MADMWEEECAIRMIAMYTGNTIVERMQRCYMENYCTVEVIWFEYGWVTDFFLIEKEGVCSDDCLKSVCL